jgi:iron complex outermembrane receptor protein
VNQTQVSARESAFTILPPERSTSYEIGAKTSFLDGRGRFNISAYYQKFTNYPFRGPGVAYVNRRIVNGVPSPEVNNFNFVAPVPVTVKGVEAEASFKITPKWSIGANASYSDGQIKNGTIACTDLDRNGVPDTNVTTPSLAVLLAALPAGENVAVCSGINRRSVTTPKFSANLQSEFGFDISNRMDGFLRASSTIFGATANDPNNTFDDVGAYGLLNLFAGLRDPKGAWEITVFGKNILGENRLLNVGGGALTTGYRTQPDAGGAVASNTFVSEYRTVTVTTPREFGISARFALGSR